MNTFEVIKTVRLTEKGTRQGEKFNQYTVVADRRANKAEIRQAVQELFKVKVIRVNTLERPRQITPPAHAPGRPSAELEKGHRDVEGRRQDCFDLAGVKSANGVTLKRRPRASSQYYKTRNRPVFRNRGFRTGRFLDYSFKRFRNSRSLTGN